MRGYPQLSLAKLEDFREKTHFKTKNEKAWSIIRSCAYFKITQKDAARDYGVSEMYVCKLLREFKLAYDKYLRPTPPGVVKVEAMILQADHDKLLELELKAKEYINLQSPLLCEEVEEVTP